MSAEFYEIARIGTGTLFIGPRPRSASLDAWCDRLVQVGVSRVVSFIGDDEVTDYRLDQEGLNLLARDIAFTHFPIVDYGAPERPGYRDIVLSEYEKLKSGHSLFAHCAGGVGRAGTFAACLLVCDSLAADEAMRIVSSKRGEVSPETDGQRAFVRSFAP